MVWWIIALIVGGGIIVVGGIVVAVYFSLKSKSNAGATPEFATYPGQCLSCGFEGTDHSLTNIGLFYYATDCQAACAKDPKCMGYTWINAGGGAAHHTCWSIPNKTYALTTNPNTFSGYRN